MRYRSGKSHVRSYEALLQLPRRRVSADGPFHDDPERKPQRQFIRAALPPSYRAARILRRIRLMPIKPAPNSQKLIGSGTVETLTENELE